MTNRCDKCINVFEPQHLNLGILIGKRFEDRLLPVEASAKTP
jgi:hypothetical protein